MVNFENKCFAVGTVIDELWQEQNMYLVQLNINIYISHTKKCIIY